MDGWYFKWFHILSTWFYIGYTYVFWLCLFHFVWLMKVHFLIWSFIIYDIHHNFELIDRYSFQNGSHEILWFLVETRRARARPVTEFLRRARLYNQLIKAQLNTVLQRPPGGSASPPGLLELGVGPRSHVPAPRWDKGCASWGWLDFDPWVQGLVLADS